MDQTNFVSLVFEKTFEEDCASLCSDVRVMDDHLHACDYLITRAPNRPPGEEIDIPFIPGTDVQVFRLDDRAIDGIYIPATRVFFRVERDGKAHMLNIEAIPPDEYEDDEQNEQLEMPFDPDV